MPVFGIAGRRIAEGIVALFALLGFAYVPLGRKTALEHTLDIFTTPAAVDAWHELGSATSRLREKLVAMVMPGTPSAAPLEADRRQARSTVTPRQETSLTLPSGRPYFDAAGRISAGCSL